MGGTERFGISITTFLAGEVAKKKEFFFWGGRVNKHSNKKNVGSFFVGVGRFFTTFFSGNREKLENPDLFAARQQPAENGWDWKTRQILDI